MDPGLCPCESGLRGLRCCALDPAALPGPQASRLLEPQAQEAIRLFNEKNHAGAEALALDLLDLAPHQRLGLRVLFEIRKAQNRVRAAETLARRLAGLPGAAALRGAANAQLAQYLVSLGRYAEAEAPAAAALIAAPGDATAHHVMGVVLTETGKLTAGERHYRRALAQLAREDGLVLANLAWNLKLQGRLEAAAALYEQALALRADNRRGIGGYAQVDFSRGKRAQSMARLDDALSRWPQDRTLRLLRALADLACGEAEAVLARLPGPPETLLAAELCARGQALARLQQPVAAVSHYAAAKKMLRARAGSAYEHDKYTVKADSYKAYFTSGRILPLPRAGAKSGRQPVFLLGFPRSGSSLLEQLLAQLPGFAAGDDTAPIAELAERVPRLAGTDAPYPQALDQALVAEGWDLPEQLRARFEAARAPLSQAPAGARSEAQFITDRAASNAWHLGLIKLLFPDAPVLHVLRHPLDIMLSILSQERALEGNCGLSMGDAARHYALTMDMIRHYRGQLTLRYLPVRYEDLVTQTGATMRRILEFLGADASALPPEAQLRANAALPVEPVPAHFAVRQPVHDRALYRHRAYARAMPKLFAGVSELLAPWIAELGYAEGGAS